MVSTRCGSTARGVRLRILTILGLFIYGDKGTLKASTMDADFIPHGDAAKPIRFDCVFEREKYPEDVTETDIELNAVPATCRHMLDFLAAIEQCSQPVADIEQGHISTASCILANVAMKLATLSAYDAARREVLNDPEATRPSSWLNRCAVGTAKMA